MPIHFGSREKYYITVSSPLATQISQAVGAAKAYKLKKNDKNIVVTYFGDGAASEGDFTTSLQFSSILRVPLLYVCRNNEYSISTHICEQYNGDGISSRCYAYNIPYIRVDGCDLFAVYEATKQAREYIVRYGTPFLVEAMTLRGCDHSTSDDSFRYRQSDEK